MTAHPLLLPPEKTDPGQGLIDWVQKCLSLLYSQFNLSKFLSLGLNLSSLHLKVIFFKGYFTDLRQGLIDWVQKCLGLG